MMQAFHYTYSMIYLFAHCNMRIFKHDEFAIAQDVSPVFSVG